MFIGYDGWSCPPPGEYLTYRLQQLNLSDTAMSEAELKGMRKLYGFDQPATSITSSGQPI